jgi:hypothetical protein
MELTWARLIWRVLHHQKPCCISTTSNPNLKITENHLSNLFSIWSKLVDIIWLKLSEPSRWIVKSNLRFCWRQCRSTGASAIGGDTLEPWQDVWDASPHTGGGGGGPAQHHTVGSPGEPPGRWVPLLVARAGWLLARADCSRFLIPFVAPTGDCSGAKGPRWWWWRTRWRKRRRRGEWWFWGRSGGNRFIHLGWNAAVTPLDLACFQNVEFIKTWFVSECSCNK